MNGWHNVSKNEPCPICGKSDWCNLADSGEVAICHRVESPYPSKAGDGWIHRLREADGRSSSGASAGYRVSLARTSAPPLFTPQSAKIDFGRVHRSYESDEILLDGLAMELGVTNEALKALDVRFNRFDNCWSFPMRDASGAIVGLRYRELGGSRKWSAHGSRDGVFGESTGPLAAPNPGPRNCQELYVVEGASDTAAALSIGLETVGRSSCMTGGAIIRELARARRVRRVTIIADSDEPGRRGARCLSDYLSRGDSPIVTRVVYPPAPHKDLRAFVRAMPSFAEARRVFDLLASAACWRV